MVKTLGIILAAGKSSRLYPATFVSSKQTLPIYDKPLIYYPLSTLMLAGIRDFVVITNPSELQTFQNLFKNCENEMGIRIRYGVQEKPKGIADAFNVTMGVLSGAIHDYDRIALILGDNIFYGAGLTEMLVDANASEKAVIFASHVADPERFGVVELDGDDVVSLIEKPEVPPSNLAVAGMYFYPKDVFEKVYKLYPSVRGELEITDLNIVYMNENNLSAKRMHRGMVWFDTGTPDSMMEAASFVHMIQKHQNTIVGSPHEVGYRNGWVSKNQLENIANICGKTNYGKYLLGLEKL